MRNTLSLLVTDSLYILIKNGRLLRLVGRVLISHLYHAPIAQTKDLPISADRANLSGKIAFPIRPATGVLCFVIRRYRPAPLKCGDTCSYNNTRRGRLYLKIDDDKLIIEKGTVTLDGRPSLVLL